MKYRIVYPDGTTKSACYLVGYTDGKPIYRRNCTTPPRKLTEREKAEQRTMLASVLGAFTYNRGF